MEGSPYVCWSPDGSSFGTTPAAYREFVRAARLRPMLGTKLREFRRGADLLAVGASIRNAYFWADLPPDVAEAISAAYERLGGATAELVVAGEPAAEPIVEFLTGPHEVFDQVNGLPALLAACKRCWTSLFTDRAIMYREVRGIDHLSAELSVLVQPARTPLPLLISGEQRVRLLSMTR
ncbi:PEP/pyruvate-binding domain-containing protein [Kribbella sp. NPDC023855]|uniref:PEP/pyruvate-binding domain-containing protein n=1 Tax=Kribbella sp. NPDC023855 TaxID=3154698 RepID=UPI0033F501B3